MSKFSTWTFALILLLCSPSLAYSKPFVVAYYSNWAQYRKAPGNYVPNNLQPIASQLSTVNYAFLFFNYRSDQSRGVTNDWMIHFAEFNDPTNLPAVVSIAKTGGAKVFISIGGWNFNDPSSSYGALTNTFFTQMVADPAKYTPFINSAIALCQAYGLGGIDLDWEFPGIPTRGGSSADYQNFANFLATFSTQLHAQGLQLTAAIPASAPDGYTSGTAVISGNTYVISTSNGQSYMDWLSGISQYFDYYNLMSYDYNGAFPGTAVTGEDSPLNPITTGALCTSSSVNSLLHNAQFPSQSTPASKIVVGVGAYGRTFGGVTFPSSLLPGQPFGPGAPFVYPGGAGYYTQQAGMLSYYEILGNLKDNFYEGTQTNSVTGTAYAWGPKLKTWVSYDSAATAFSKGQYIKANNLRGGMIYALDFDNFFDSISPYAITNNLANGIGG